MVSKTRFQETSWAYPISWDRSIVNTAITRFISDTYVTALYCSVLQCVSNTSCHSLVLQCVAVCYSVLQCVAVGCSGLQCVAACCSVFQILHVTVLCCSVLCRRVLQSVAEWCSVLQCVAVCCSVVQCVAVRCNVLQCVAVFVCCNVLQCVAVCCSVLHCVAACCSVLHCVAMCCSVLQCASDTSCRSLVSKHHHEIRPCVDTKKKSTRTCFIWYFQCSKNSNSTPKASSTQTLSFIYIF